ncbi:MAG TPA: hypothetical protein VH186_20725 [Chloroflexia bacterium]|nr:hypothetical protein [Chloroflexia bacterium]
MTDNATSGTSSWLQDPVVVAIHDAFLLGSKLVELKSRVQLALVDLQAASVAFQQSDQPADTPSALLNSVLHRTYHNLLDTTQEDSAWLMGQWRGIFNCIATLHRNHFSDAKTLNTPYSPPTDLATLNYLQKSNYNDFGIPELPPDISVPPKTLEGFELYNLSRRALNCFLLLLIKPENTLFPETTAEFRNALLQVIGKPEEQATLDLGNRVIKLLEAWDCFVRENYYNAGAIKDNEIELIAYEAGRAMASLSWGISVRTVPLEKLATSDFSTLAQLKAAWQEVFDNRDIAHLQHQVTSLSAALDEAYSKITVKSSSAQGSTTTQVSSPELALLVQVDPNLPSQGIQAIRHSLSYWQRLLEGLVITPQDAQARLNSGLLALQLSNVKQYIELRTTLIHQADIWQALLSGQQGMATFSAETVTQKMLDNFVDELEEAITKQTSRSLSNYRFLIGGAIGLVVLVLVALFVLVLKSNGGDNSMTAILLALAGAGGFWGVNTAVKSNSGTTSAAAAPATGLNTGLSGRLTGVLSSIGTEISDALQRGYRQILIEFGYFNYSVSVTYPLVEFFIFNNVTISNMPVKNGYDFLVQVIWTKEDRQEELQRITRAAFGPLGSFVVASGTAKESAKPKASQPVLPQISTPSGPAPQNNPPRMPVPVETPVSSPVAAG